MTEGAPREIVVAGAGIAGLTAALAFARHGFEVRVLERASRLEEVGAGLQLSPNATRLLGRLGVLDRLGAVAVEPEAVVLRDGASLRTLSSLPFGRMARTRWGAPYLALHRGDLHGALAAQAAETPGVRVELDTAVAGIADSQDGIVLAADKGGMRSDIACPFLVGADGVRSAVRGFGALRREARFGREIAWRTLAAADSPAGKMLAGLVGARSVTAFLRPGFHLIVYPVRGGQAFNLAAFTEAASADGAQADDAPLCADLARCAPPLRALAGLAWNAWPIGLVDPAPPWVLPEGVALIGDAAHAATPYAAQGAGMAIEDAVALAGAVARAGRDLPAALRRWESARRARVGQVLKRAALNRLAWHARGPAALARNAFLGLRGGERLAADMDWLYGFDAEGNGGRQ